MEIKYDLGGKTKEERIENLLGEILAYRNNDKMLREIVSSHVGVLWDTIKFRDNLKS